MTGIYDIIYHPDPILKHVSAPISSITPDITAQAEKMLLTMRETGNSIGLAANQVNIGNRIFVMDFDPHGWEYKDPNARVLEVQGRRTEVWTPNPTVLINPVIVKASDQKSVCLEGCLSLPEQFADVERPAHITVEYLDLNGEKQEWGVSGYESHIVQHELDHLDGILFIDYLSRLKRNTLVRKLEKWKKSEGII